MSPKSLKTILIEAIVVGLLLIPFTYIATFVARRVVKSPSLPKICKSWNKFYTMEVTLILAGMLFHIVLEYVGINKMYVDNYYK